MRDLKKQGTKQRKKKKQQQPEQPAALLFNKLKYKIHVIYRPQKPTQPCAVKVEATQEWVELTCYPVKCPDSIGSKANTSELTQQLNLSDASETS